MAGTLSKVSGPAKPNEMRVKDPPNRDWQESACGQHGPEKQSGYEGPDTDPRKKGG